MGVELKTWGTCEKNLFKITEWNPALDLPGRLDLVRRTDVPEEKSEISWRRTQSWRDDSG